MPTWTKAIFSNWLTRIVKRVSEQTNFITKSSSTDPWSQMTKILNLNPHRQLSTYHALIDTFIKTANKRICIVKYGRWLNSFLIFISKIYYTSSSTLKPRSSSLKKLPCFPLCFWVSSLLVEQSWSSIRRSPVQKSYQ